jgi:hypothetical protein
MGIRRKPEGAQMPRPTVTPDLVPPDYTRVSGIGDAANGAGKASLGAPDAATPPTQLMEIAMTRMFATAAVLALTITAAQAGPSGELATRIHDAAVTACAPERVSGALPVSHYGAIEDQCVYRISQSAMHKYQAQAAAAQSTKLADK